METPRGIWPHAARLGQRLRVRSLNFGESPLSHRGGDVLAATWRLAQQEGAPLSSWPTVQAALSGGAARGPFDEGHHLVFLLSHAVAGGVTASCV